MGEDIVKLQGMIVGGKALEGAEAVQAKKEADALLSDKKVKKAIRTAIRNANYNRAVDGAVQINITAQKVTIVFERRAKEIFVPIKVESGPQNPQPPVSTSVTPPPPLPTVQVDRLFSIRAPETPTTEKTVRVAPAALPAPAQPERHLTRSAMLGEETGYHYYGDLTDWRKVYRTSTREEVPSVLIGPTKGGAPKGNREFWEWFGSPNKFATVRQGSTKVAHLKEMGLENPSLQSVSTLVSLKPEPSIEELSEYHLSAEDYSQYHGIGLIDLQEIIGHSEYFPEFKKGKFFLSLQGWHPKKEKLNWGYFSNPWFNDHPLAVRDQKGQIVKTPDGKQVVMSNTPTEGTVSFGVFLREPVSAPKNPGWVRVPGHPEYLLDIRKYLKKNFWGRPLFPLQPLENYQPQQRFDLSKDKDLERFISYLSDNHALQIYTEQQKSLEFTDGKGKKYRLEYGNGLDVYRSATKNGEIDRWGDEKKPVEYISLDAYLAKTKKPAASETPTPLAPVPVVSRELPIGFTSKGEVAALVAIDEKEYNILDGQMAGKKMTAEELKNLGFVQEFFGHLENRQTILTPSNIVRLKLNLLTDAVTLVDHQSEKELQRWEPSEAASSTLQMEKKQTLHYVPLNRSVWIKVEDAYQLRELFAEVKGDVPKDLRVDQKAKIVFKLSSSDLYLDLTLGGKPVTLGKNPGSISLDDYDLITAERGALDQMRMETMNIDVVRGANSFLTLTPTFPSFPEASTPAVTRKKPVNHLNNPEPGEGEILFTNEELEEAEAEEANALIDAIDEGVFGKATPLAGRTKVLDLPKQLPSTAAIPKVQATLLGATDKPKKKKQVSFASPLEQVYRYETEPTNTLSIEESLFLMQESRLLPQYREQALHELVANEEQGPFALLPEMVDSLYDLEEEKPSDPLALRRVEVVRDKSANPDAIHIELRDDIPREI